MQQHSWMLDQEMMKKPTLRKKEHLRAQASSIRSSKPHLKLQPRSKQHTRRQRRRLLGIQAPPAIRLPKTAQPALLLAVLHMLVPVLVS